MQPSHNVLVIESLDTIMEQDNNTAWFKSKMNASIKFYCSVNGSLLKSIPITSEGVDYSNMASLKKAIQNFLLGKFSDGEAAYFDKGAISFASKNIHAISIEVPEPFKSLFEQLFDLQGWEIPKLELPPE